MRTFSTISLTVFIISFIGFSSIAQSENDNTINTSTMTLDFYGAEYIENFEGIVVVGHNGLVGTLKIAGESATLEPVPNTPDVDFTAIGKLDDSSAFLGSATGKLYKLSGGSVELIGEVSEYGEPVLDIAHDNGITWVVGARGMLSKSSDNKNFETVEIIDAVMPKTKFPGGQAVDWYLGVQNLNLDSLKLTGAVNGKPAVEDEDYIVYADEGFIQFQREFDTNPAPTVSTKFDPGPPFRRGDVSWNKVLLGNGMVTIAGEFGMILQSSDGGDTWTRRDSSVIPKEPEPPYWISGVQKGNIVWLAGAAGVNASSNDGGKTWTYNKKPGREGVFGVQLTGDNVPIITGAVGLVGVLKTDGWALADRTQLKILSWLKNPVMMPDNSVIVLGGRATAIRVKDGEYTRINVSLKD